MPYEHFHRIVWAQFVLEVVSSTTSSNVCVPLLFCAALTRTRDPAKLDTFDIVVDIGAVYDPVALRFDHHHRVRMGLWTWIPHRTIFSGTYLQVVFLYYLSSIRH